VAAILLGLAVGLIVGAGVVGLIWAGSGPADAADGAQSDAAAVCGGVERTPLPTRDTPIEEMRRWGIAELGPSPAKQDAALRPLADALEQAYRSLQVFDFEKMSAAVTRAKALCAVV
jgi:hypothetical protein